MGEWVDIVIDENLPLRRRAAPSETDEWWVPLTEKAYAKFCGSYDRIVGGNTCWAMTDLTGGITVEMKNLNAENADMIKQQETFNLSRNETEIRRPPCPEPDRADSERSFDHRFLIQK